MTRDDIIRMAREADLLVLTQIPDDSVFVADLERFFHAAYAAGAAAECGAFIDIINDNTDGDGICCADDLLEAIRLREGT